MVRRVQETPTDSGLDDLGEVGAGGLDDLAEVLERLGLRSSKFRYDQRSCSASFLTCAVRSSAPSGYAPPGPDFAPRDRKSVV